LVPPKGKPARKAIETLRVFDPAGTYTLDHVYEPARAPLSPAKGPAAGGGPMPAGGTRIGLIDGGVGRHPAFAGAEIEQRGFAGDARPSGHGTAIASLIVGNAGPFRGAALGTPLLVADVYGGAASNGSALAIVRAMAWLAQKGARMVNISLVGPPNPLLEAGVKALMARGILVVAAVGNDGPAAPPQYPASYLGVIAVTGVDARGRALIEAGRALHLDFAAPGADMAGAVPGGGWEVLRGTSFAAPLVTASLARAGSFDALAAEARPGSGKVGRGIVCGECRTPPRAVGLR
jgi:subtilisin family serine protease